MQWLGMLGAWALGRLGSMGRMAVFLGATLVGAVVPPFRVRRLVGQVYFIGAQSLGLICITGAFTGMVLGLQGFFTLRKFGSEALLGPAVALSLLRELGPVLAALMVTARAGSAMAAEIGAMRVTEQIDALEAMALNPIQFLMAPRLLAGLATVPLLTAVFDVVGIYGGYLVGVKLLGLSGGAYFAQMRGSVGLSDINGGFLKALVFGGLIAWVSGYKGYYAGYGAEGVSRATTEAVVLCAVLILIGDYVLTALLF
jgi:phospholipid/cholesterol/gamma-HCH transport system permease protein